MKLITAIFKPFKISDVNEALKAVGIQVWDLGAIRRGLAEIGLDWPTTTGDGTDAHPPRAIRAIEVEDAPWLEPW